MQDIENISLALWAADADPSGPTSYNSSSGEHDSVALQAAQSSYTIEDGSTYSAVEFVFQGSQPEWTKNPYSRCEEAIMEKFDIWSYHSTMNSSELPYPYHIFIVF